VKRLWAPWRVTYITATKVSGCIFCDAPGARDYRAALVLHRASLGFLILNRYPYNSGHVMAVPYRHVARLEQLAPKEMQELMALSDLAVRALERAMSPEGFNIGLNLGRAAGAGIDDHLHIHVVPRWAGDTNFMPVLGDVKVLPEDLEATYDRLAAALAAIESESPGG
jgi:ATP adenylyltransferase